MRVFITGATRAPGRHLVPGLVTQMTTELADSLSMAFLVLLKALSPRRTRGVQVFGYDYRY